MRTALLQMTSSDDPVQNLGHVRGLLHEAAAAGAGFALTPEVTNCVSLSRTHQAQVLRNEAQDATLAGLRDTAAKLGIWLLIGSLAVKSDPPEDRFANRSFLIAPDGEIRARYDKIHMFDVDVSETESYRESSGYAPGDRAVVAPTPFGTLGLSICYDIRFPHLYRALAQAGAQILTVPSAFSPVTGAAHWESLLRARAIETGAWVLAPAQTGTHPASTGKSRSTYGHSMVISPWGEVIADAGTEPGLTLVDLDLNAVSKARARIPSLTHTRSFESP
ncbi:carbon-nitrogen hydrolase family protein [Primorskyibacter marinus]|uniref:carbon-nitrogen hydrolase family protein n=1 Tax=Primorskyibacter marinus TaxID=1977320 RepID=UPI000E3044DB|nr:carbon-nitrogen hydrolase family protein [Primorskyibacter marinus]